MFHSDTRTLMGGCPVRYCTSCLYIICLNLRLKALNFCLTCFSNFIYNAIFTKITLYCKSVCILIEKNSFQNSITFGLAKVYVLGMGMMNLSLISSRNRLKARN